MVLFSSTRRRDREAAGRLYAACVNAARAPALFLTFGVPDTLQGRFEMLSLHLFPVLHRLMHDPGDDPELARLVSETFVADMDAAMREMGVGDVTVPKRMKKLYASFAGRITAYKDAAASGQDALASAVVRNVFPDDAQDDRAARLAAYMMQTLGEVRDASLDAIRRGDVPFQGPQRLSDEEVKGVNAEPFSYLVLVRDIPAGGRTFHIEAEEAERLRCAEALGIPAVETLTADLDVQPATGRGFRVRGRLKARVIQTDVVTLEPVKQDVAENVDVVLMPEEAAGRRATRNEILVDITEEDGPELFRNGRIDLGLIVGEHLALGLDPYPRAPGTDFSGYVESDPQADASAFGALVALRKTGE